MRNVGTAMATTESVSAALRPMRSPMCPKTSPPTGRIMKPAANTPKAAISEATGSFDGKKWAPIVCAK
jgi:hypothetical protein